MIKLKEILVIYIVFYICNYFFVLYLYLEDKYRGKKIGRVFMLVEFII